MTTLPDPSFDQRIADWLERDPNAAPDAVLDTVLAAVPSITQRRRVPGIGLDRGIGLGGRRTSPMNTTLKFTLGAAAAIVVAVAGMLVVGRPSSPGVGGGPLSTPTPTPTVARSPSGAPTLESRFELPFAMTFPGDWEVAFDQPDYFAVARTMPNGDPIVGVDLALVSNVYADPCDPEAGIVETLPSGNPVFGGLVGDFVGWFTLFDQRVTDSDVRLNVSPGLAPVDVGPYRAIRMDEEFVASATCPALALWETRIGPYPLYEAERKQFFVLDVAGRTVIAVLVAQDDNFGDVAGEGMAVLETLEFR